MAFVKLVGFDGSSIGSWAEVPLLEGDTVARFADRACTKFPNWGVNATQASLYRVEWTGEDVPSAEAERIALDGLLLQPTWSLARADIKSGTCVLVRKTVGAAASGACACLLSDHPRSLTSCSFPCRRGGWGRRLSGGSGC